MRNADQNNFKSCSRGQLFLCSLFSLLSLQFAFAQKTQVIDRSNFKHDYVLDRAAYLEDIKDTLGCKYIATLNVTCKSHPGSVLDAVSLIGIKAKEFGGNTFYLSSFTESDSSLAMVVKLYYAFKKTFDQNETKRVKNGIMIFSFLKHHDRYQYFYINDSIYYVNSRNYFKLNTVPDKKYVITACNKSGVALSAFTVSGGEGLGINYVFKGRIGYKASQDDYVLFLCLYTDKLLYQDQCTKEKHTKVFKCGINDVEYRSGRVLMELLKQEK